MEPLDQFVADMLAFEESMFPAKISLAMSYVPNQPFENLFEVDDALYKGTIFKDLAVPFSAYKNNPIMSPFK